MPPSTSNVDAALIARLMNDAQLRALLPDGVYWGVAGKNATRFVLVSQAMHDDIDAMSGRAFEQILYLVKAVEHTAHGSNIIAAADRIDALLQDATLTVPGYTFLHCTRRNRVRDTEPDENNADQRWQHRGGFYWIWVTP